MKPEHIDGAKRKIARQGYASRRIAKLRRKLYSNAVKYYKRCDFSKVSAAFYDAEQVRIAKKIVWYERNYRVA